VWGRHAIEKGNDRLALGVGDEAQGWHFKSDDAWISGFWHGELSFQGRQW
jgi:hypothetical protein